MIVSLWNELQMKKILLKLISLSIVFVKLPSLSYSNEYFKALYEKEGFHAVRGKLVNMISEYAKTINELQREKNKRYGLLFDDEFKVYDPYLLIIAAEYLVRNFFDGNYNIPEEQQKEFSQLLEDYTTIVKFEPSKKPYRLKEELKYGGIFNREFNVQN